MSDTQRSWATLSRTQLCCSTKLLWATIGKQIIMALVTQTTIISRPKCFVNRFNALSSKSYGNANQPLTRNVSKYWPITIHQSQIGKTDRRIEMISIKQFSCWTRQKLGNSRCQTGNFVEQQSCATKLPNFVACLTWALVYPITWPKNKL